jgi:tetratricopeptide (TPR) repeat protein
VGENLGDFHLFLELGRGSQGRVFLASQAALADRSVVLKVTGRGSGEHLTLARLQHTHIVPLYSVQDDPSRGLRVLCMPYFGGTTLASILARLKSVPVEQRKGRHLLDALRQAQLAAPCFVAVEGPACRFLAQASYVQAVCWLGACLADALQYAHERGLVHLDLKPSNVLLAADGQPMLLDLHLARAPIPANAPAPSWLGGTAAYMAPEQQAAVAAVALGEPVPQTVDGRADVHALGLVLHELLGGEVPTSPGQRLCNSHVSAGLADLLSKCRAPDSVQRYADASALAADLRRHLADLPLRGVPNRSWAERWRKWRRRRPLAPALAGLLLAIGLVAGLVLLYFGRQLDKARTALGEGRDLFAVKEYRQAQEAWKRGLALAEDVPFGHELAKELRDHLRQGDQAQAAQDLHQFAERIRGLASGGSLPPEARAVAAHCHTFWERRGWITERLGSLPDLQLREQIKTDLLDLAVLGADLRVRLAPVNEVDASRRQALGMLADAEVLFGPSAVTCSERQAQARALGMTEAAETARREGAALLPRSAWEHFTLGRARFHAGDITAAAEDFKRALALEPRAFWPTFYQGQCAYRRRHYEDALLALTACTTLAPDRAWCWYNRGLAFAALGKLERAMLDYDRALQLDPTLAPAWLARSWLHLRAGRYASALADLQKALDHGTSPVGVHFRRTLVFLCQGNQRAAWGSMWQAISNGGRMGRLAPPNGVTP